MSSMPDTESNWTLELVADGKNVFVAEAACDMPVGWARSGLEGYASIDVGDRSPLWIVKNGCT